MLSRPSSLPKGLFLCISHLRQHLLVQDVILNPKYDRQNKQFSIFISTPSHEWNHTRPAHSPLLSSPLGPVLCLFTNAVMSFDRWTLSHSCPVLSSACSQAHGSTLMTLQSSPTHRVGRVLRWTFFFFFFPLRWLEDPVLVLSTCPQPDTVCNI